MAEKTDKSQISHLIKLLDDRDDFVHTRVREELIALGEDALPFLHIASGGENPVIRVSAQEIARAIFPKQLEEKFRHLSLASRGKDLDLEAGMLILAEFAHPDVDPASVRSQLDRLAAEFSERLQDNRTPQDIVKLLANFLFNEKKFAGNRENFFDADNSYIHTVLERKAGIPISLSAICILIAKRLNLPIVGVGLPGHFIVKYDAPGSAILFDPFYKGRVLTREQCAQRVQSLGRQFEEHYLGSCTHREILVRMINNLIMIHNNAHEEQKARQLTEYIHILMGPPQRHTTRPA